jgi:hypothetical protein
VHRLDPATLFVAQSVTFGVVALVMVFYYATQRSHPGFRDWLAGAVAQAVALLAFFLIGSSRTRLAVTFLVNALVVVGIDRFYRGTVRFAGKEPRLTAVDAAVYGAGLVAYGWWLVVDYHVPRRILVFSLCAAYGTAKMAVAASRVAHGPYRTSGLFLTFANLATVALWLARAAAVLARVGQRPDELLQRSGLEAVLLAAVTGAGVVAILAFMILNGRRTTAELEEALGQVKQLEGIIPICMYCRKVRVDPDSWHQLERYVVAHTHARFSHGICPDCYGQHHGRPPDPPR